MIRATVFAILAAAVIFAAIGSGTANAAEAADKKILVAYFSRSGNTAQIATEIQRAKGGDLFEIRAQKTYPADYQTTTEVAKAELEKDERPALAANIANMRDYDVVFLGYPIWWGTMPMAVFTFLEANDFSGKTVVPFCTHGGGGGGRSVDDLKRTLPAATVMDAFVVRGANVSSVQGDVSSWLRNLGI
ncbi:NAD(P)H-dependent oxidoreductase [Synergistaceae bacterium OttesenSCG-928-D05]|nr:NAD(P)H-dependent oxidoreductase [Synergistaceae bacterium OttesenSCG-928-D05]